LFSNDLANGVSNLATNSITSKD